MSYSEIILNGYRNYYNFLVYEILNPSWNNYFYYLIGFSLLCLTLEFFFPWRKNQAFKRDGFWLDLFYLFFNFFIFSLIIYSAGSDLFVKLFNDFLALFKLKNIVAIEIQRLPDYLQLLIMFVLRDFIQWNIHRLMHHNKVLWEFHKVHHSVQEMGFASHYRFHFMETIIYRSLEYIPLAMIGFGLTDFFLVYIFAFSLGHLNHANIYLPLGPLKYIFNNPQMHIWHHAKIHSSELTAVNYGLSLSIWDYMFGKAYIPKDGRHEVLGFEKIEEYPRGFINHLIEPIKSSYKKLK